MTATPPPAEPKYQKPSWDQIAGAIREMGPAEIAAFESTHKISIVAQNTDAIKKFKDMTPEEQKAFMTLHGITPEKHPGIKSQMKG